MKPSANFGEFPFPDVGKLCVMVPVFTENWVRFSTRLDDVTQTVRFELVNRKHGYHHPRHPDKEKPAPSHSDSQ